MKYRILSFVFLLLQVPHLQAQLRFQKVYGFSNTDSGTEFNMTSDGGFIMVGRGTGVGNCYVIRIDHKGDTLWTKSYGEFDVEGANGVQQTSDSGFIITGYTYSFGANSQMLVIKTDSLGVVQWTRIIGGAGGEQGICIRQTTDGGYILSGASTTNGAGVDDAATIRLDANGIILWSKRFGSTSYDQATCVRQTPDGGFIFVGSTGQPTGTFIFLMRTDANGDTLWVKRYGVGSEGTNSVELTSDGGFVISGASATNGGDVLLFKTDSLGNVAWGMSYGGLVSEVSHGLKQTSDGGYILTGNTNSYGAGGTDVYLLKTDSTGTLEWSMAYGGTGAEQGREVFQASDGGYFVFGNAPSLLGYNGYYLIKTDANGFSNCNEVALSSGSSTYVIPISSPVWVYSTGWTDGLNTISASDRNTNIGTLCTNVGLAESLAKSEIVEIVPNPSSGNFGINISGKKKGHVMIVDQIGKMVIEKYTDDISSEKFSLNICRSGIYVVKVFTDNKVYSGKLVIVDN